MVRYLVLNPILLDDVVAGLKELLHFIMRELRIPVPNLPNSFRRFHLRTHRPAL